MHANILRKQVWPRKSNTKLQLL